MTALASVRQVARGYLAEMAEGMQVEPCTVVHPGAAVADGAGGFTLGTPVRVTTQCQRRTTLTDAEREFASRLAIVRPVVVSLPLTTSLDESDVIEVGGVTLAVKGVTQGTWSIRVRALCEQDVMPVVG
jgi:hypothetical protein